MIQKEQSPEDANLNTPQPVTDPTTVHNPPRPEEEGIGNEVQNEVEEMEADNADQTHQEDLQQETSPRVTTPPQEGTLLEASVHRIRRMEEIMQILPYLCEPLHSAYSMSE